MRTRHRLGMALLASLVTQLTANAWGSNWPVCENYDKTATAAAAGLDCSSSSSLVRSSVIWNAFCKPSKACWCYHRTVDERKLNYVDCSSANLKEVPSGIPVDAEVLLLNSNKLRSIGEQEIAKRMSYKVSDFSGELAQLQLNQTWGVTPVSNLTLRKLYLHNNDRLAKLANHTFKHLPHLAKLTVHHTGLTQLTRSQLEGLGSSLRVLWAQYSEITTVEQGMFANFANLKQLWLQHNQIEKFHQRIFEPLTSLDSLHLEGNNVENATCCMMCGLQNTKPLMYMKHSHHNLRCGCGDAPSHPCADCFDSCVEWHYHKGSHLFNIPNKQMDYNVVRFSVMAAMLVTGLSLVWLLFYHERAFTKSS